MAKRRKQTVGPTVVRESAAQSAALEARFYQAQSAFLTERLAEFEMEIENKGWLRLYGGSDDWEIKRDFVAKVVKLARMMHFKNPLIKRTVGVQSLYTFALGMSIESEYEPVQNVIDEFMNDPRNKSIIGTHLSRLHLDASLATDGQIFFVLFTDSEMKCLIRTLPFDEIVDIITNPNDKFDPWFYHRKWSVQTDIQKAPIEVEALYPRVGLYMANSPETYNGIQVRWSTPVYHAKGPNSLHGNKWCMPETYAQLDWATAYKNFLEDWLTIMRSYSRMAMQISGLNKQQAAAARSQVKSTNASDGQFGAAGQHLFTSAGVDIKAVRTAGATTSAEEGRPVKLMVAAASGLPETFFGDADVGNFATSETLDRPTELQMKSRQEMWRSYLQAIFQYVIQQSSEPGGYLSQHGCSVAVVTDITNDILLCKKTVMGTVGPTGMSDTVDVQFPDILERNVGERIRALVGAFTMNGRPFHNIIDDRRLIASMILEALGWDTKRRKAVIDRLYPPGTAVEPLPEPDYTKGSGDNGDNEPPPDDKKKPAKKERK